ncbi:glycosyltransferase [Coxiella-like endosymbiont of Rhipicephalus sanguineus]|uniref:glycosyltransferase n=1 Tax=Coxiella-like endosymbiont of Rhipicephalus sanguineus TaxID=1955402 RepID=UPI0020422F2A|nr:glycosyltransferase [Coxiella-like endosymbiont of Rhipicephalus sanguineus]
MLIIKYRKLKQRLKAFYGGGDEVLVVDSYSTDGTSELAEKLGAQIVQLHFKGFGDFRNQAIAVC